MLMPAEPTWSHADAVGEQGAALVPSRLLQQGTQLSPEKVLNVRELLAAFLSVKKFRHFLEGRKFQLKTDHQSLNPSLLREKASD